MPAPGKWLPWQAARDLVASMGFRDQDAFYAWKDRPAGIPSNPRDAYSEWSGWAYFLGNGPPSDKARNRRSVKFLPYPEARELAHRLIRENEIADQTQWVEFAKSKLKPPEIPADPSKAYQGKGWLSWSDWLRGEMTRTAGNEPVRCFEAAREFARTLKLESEAAWFEWSSAGHRPSDIPENPDLRYAKTGWINWSDFLGYQRRWTHRNIISFIRSLEPCIEQLTELDLYLILSRNGMLGRDTRLRAAGLLKALCRVRTPAGLHKAEEFVLAEVASEVESNAPDSPDLNAVSVDELLTEPPQPFRELKILESLQAVDFVSAFRITDDQEVLDFMIAERVAMLWQEVIAAGADSVLSRLSQLLPGPFSALIRERFETELSKVAAIAKPPGYHIVDANGQPVELNLMQKLTAHRLLHERRLGNWSGVGAGKTNAAVFASAFTNARLTIVLAANATVASWKKTIRRSFDAGDLHVHDGKPSEFRHQPEKRNFLVLNYESFQQRWSAEYVSKLSELDIDFIVLDEVQFARQRSTSPSRASARRKQIANLVGAVAARNPELRILAMSATPVVNNLTEGVKLLELLWPERDFSDVATGASTANAIGLHRLLQKYGIRYVPRYDLQLVKTPIAIDGQEWFDRLITLRARDVLAMEQTLLEVKIQHLDKWVRPGTLIYTHYVEGMVDRLTAAVTSMGYRVSHFTGDSRIPIDRFVDDVRAGRADVLIGSSPVGTGVDGLQFVLDRVVFISLPWSHAEYEQIVGRLWRQGSAFKTVEVIIPQVTLRHDGSGQWSWDDLRLRCIEYKRNLADAALDGFIPQGGLPSREELQRQKLMELRKWAQAVEDENCP